MAWALAAWTVTHGISSLWIEGALADGPLGATGIERVAGLVLDTLAPIFRLPAARPGRRRQRNGLAFTQRPG